MTQSSAKLLGLAGIFRCKPVPANKGGQPRSYECSVTYRLFNGRSHLGRAAELGHCCRLRSRDEGRLSAESAVRQDMSGVRRRLVVTGDLTGAFFGPGAEQIGGAFAVSQVPGNPLLSDVFIGAKN